MLTADINGDRLFARMANYVNHPAWYQTIIMEVESLLMTSTIINLMITGDKAATQLYWIKIWPFVHAFTSCVETAIRDFKQIAFPHTVDTAVVTQALAWLQDQRNEEEWHQDLWPQDAMRAGVFYHQLDGPIHPSVHALIDNMVSGPTLVHRMLRFVTTEIVAELVGKRLLESPAFNALHHVDKVMWCAVHVQDRSPGHLPTHEELGHRIAQLIADIGYGPQPTEEFCWQEIMHTARLFHAMGEPELQEEL